MRFASSLKGAESGGFPDWDWREEDGREKLVNDLKDKRHALSCDNSCLTMRPERAARHPPPHRETLHTAVTTMAGEVPPASPTAILNGESAALP